MGPRDSLLFSILRLEGSVDESRVPMTLPPRALFADPLSYMRSVHRLKRLGLVTTHPWSRRHLWDDWFGTGPWMRPRLWDPTTGWPQAPAVLLQPQPILAARLYEVARLSDATGFTARSLTEHGFNPRWADSAHPALRSSLEGRRLGRVLSGIDRAMGRLASMCLKGHSRFELAAALPALINDSVQVEVGWAPPPKSMLGRWVAESLAEKGISYPDAAPAEVYRLSRRRAARLCL